jgi:hypothetical protein
MFHISNRYLDLEPVVADLAEHGGWHAAMLQYDPNEEERMMNATVSIWIALSRNRDTLDRLVSLSGEGQWQYLAPRPNFAGWSDDYASILPILRRPDWPWE